MQHLDEDLVFAGLDATERAAVAGLLGDLGLEVGDWVHVPGLRGLVEAVAVYRAAAGVVGVSSRRECFRIGAEALGAEEEPEGTHAGDVVEKRVYRWHKRASEATTKCPRDLDEAV